MAFTDSKTDRSTEGLSAFLHASFDRVKEAYDRRTSYQATRRELALLSDRELADIGVSRGSIDEVARSAA